MSHQHRRFCESVNVKSGHVFLITFSRSEKKMVNVRHKRHAKMISDFLNMDPAKEQVEEVQTAGVDSDNNSGIKVAVEGNISSGKSTFLQAVGQLSDNLRSSTHLVPEPVEMWTDDKGIALPLFFCGES